MTGITGELDALKNEASAEDAAKDERQDKLLKLRERIKNGESTGDRLRDLTIIIQGDDEKLLQVFKDLERRLAGKKGQLFCLAEYRERRHLHHGDFYAPPRPEPELVTFAIGVLSDEKIEIGITNATWKIPCIDYVRSRSKIDGPAAFDDEYSSMSYLLHHWGRGELHGHPEPKIFIGEEEVFTFFRNELHRFVREEDVIKRDIVRQTYGLTVPDGHWLHQGRLDWRDHNFREALALEEKILRLRFLIENYRNNDANADFRQTIKELRESIRKLNTRLQLAIQLGIDPNRSEVLRIQQNFGHYWA